MTADRYNHFDRREEFQLLEQSVKIKEYDLNLPVQGKRQLLAPGRLLTTETLLRLNPHWVITDLVAQNDTFTAAVKDHESERKNSEKTKHTVWYPQKDQRSSFKTTFVCFPMTFQPFQK